MRSSTSLGATSCSPMGDRPHHQDPSVDWLQIYDSHTVGPGRFDPSSPEAANRRLARIEAALPVTVKDAVWVESAVNNVWRIGDLYLRISFRGDRTRLRREAMILEALPPAIPHIEVVDVGRADDLEWMLSKAVAGTNLATITNRLPVDEYRRYMVQLAESLAVLHDWSPPAAVATAL